MEVESPVSCKFVHNGWEPRSLRHGSGPYLSRAVVVDLRLAGLQRTQLITPCISQSFTKGAPPHPLPSRSPNPWGGRGCGLGCREEDTRHKLLVIIVSDLRRASVWKWWGGRWRGIEKKGEVEAWCGLWIEPSSYASWKDNSLVHMDKHNIFQIHIIILWDWQHSTEYFSYSYLIWRIICGIFSFLLNIVMDLNNVMRWWI